MLAMVVNDDVGCLNARGVWATIASMLAPTVVVVGMQMCAWHQTLWGRWRGTDVCMTLEPVGTIIAPTAADTASPARSCCRSALRPARQT